MNMHYLLNIDNNFI